MDVVALFKAGWPHASAEQKQAMTAEIEKMLHWCLTESLQADGSFKSHIADGSIEEGEYYATSFLARIGFFDKKERFWTGREFPEATAIREKILAYVRAHQTTGGSGGGYYESILKDCLKVSGWRSIIMKADADPPKASESKPGGSPAEFLALRWLGLNCRAIFQIING